jgi:hypothetical protein
MKICTAGSVKLRKTQSRRGIQNVRTNVSTATFLLSNWILFWRIAKKEGWNYKTGKTNYSQTVVLNKIKHAYK